MAERKFNLANFLRHRAYLWAAVVGFLGAYTAFYIAEPAMRGDARNKAEAAHYAGSYTDAAYEEANRACKLVAEAIKPKCIDKILYSYREDQREEYDLQAQREAADWTRATGMAALAAFWVSIVGVVMVFATFSEAQRQANEIQESVRAAQRSAAAMENVAEAMALSAQQFKRSAAAGAEQVDIARDTAVRHMRAYLAVNKVWIEDLEAGKKLVVICQVQNTGLTPAKRVAATAGVASPQPLKNYGIPDIPMAKKDVRFELGARGKVDVFAQTTGAITKAQLSQIESCATQVYVQLSITYEDVFGQERRSEFLFRSTGRDDLGFEPCGGEEHNFSC